jgi:serine/threonine-protein kinase RsbW
VSKGERSAARHDGHAGPCQRETWNEAVPTPARRTRVVQTEPVDPPWVTSRFPSAAQSAAEVRHALCAHLETSRASAEALYDIEVVASEMVANAVRHGKPDDDGTIDVSWRTLGDRVQLRVHDHGHVAGLAPFQPSPIATGGRGLAIIAELAESWSYADVQGTEVAATLRLAG